MEKFQIDEEKRGRWMSAAKKRIHHWGDYTKTLIKWLAFSVLVGVVVGAVGALFHMAIDEAAHLREANGWILYLLPLVGLVIVFAYRVTGMSDDKGTEYIISSARDAHYLRIRTAPLIFLSTVLTHFAGGSAGREGAALQLGGSMSNSIGRLLRLDGKNSRVMTMCGMAAGFSALFGTPLAAAVMAMEVVSVGFMHYEAIVPCIMSALIAQQAAIAIGVHPTAFSVAVIPEITPVVLVRLVVLGVLCGIVAILFCNFMHAAPKFYGKITKNPYVKVALGGVIVILMTLVFGTDYNGAGTGIIQRALDGSAAPEAFLLKILFTGLTLAAGFKGGEIVPAFFTGATFGCFVGGLLGLPASFAGAAGLAAVFCGVTNCPLTAILLSYELFGGEGLILYALCCAVSYLISGYSSLYHAQNIVLSKLQPEIIHVAEETDEF